MKKVITYGTFDLLHHGHINLLKRARELGDYLIVGVTGEIYDKNRGKLNVHRSTLERVEDVRQTGLADEIIIEEIEGQKIEDIQKYNVDIFAIGSDWLGKFDYLNEYCKVVYLERTKGVSSTQLRGQNQKILDLGIIGTGRIAERFVKESKFVSGVNVSGVYNPTFESGRKFIERNELSFNTNSLIDFFDKVDLVYIASPHKFHYEHVKQSLLNNKHVLCEKPLVMNANQAIELYKMAEEKELILMEAIKTAYSPAFIHLIALVKSGAVGTVRDIDATFTKLVRGDIRELDPLQHGGSITELASYTLLPIIKIFGKEYKNLSFYSVFDKNVDIYTRGILEYKQGIGTFKVGLGVKSEGNLIISGTKGYIYVPSPWWKTEYFEVRYEDFNQNRKYFFKFDGEGLRYELFEFITKINNNVRSSQKLTSDESIAISTIIESFLEKKNLNIIS